jgi:spore coat protein SA
MKITMVHGEWLPVPPVLGGPVEQILYETAMAVQEPELTVISRWDTAFFENGVPEKFHHVDLDAQETEIKRVMKGVPAQLQSQEARQRFCYLNGATNILNTIDPDVIEIHSIPEVVTYMRKQFPNKRIMLYMHNEPPFWSTDLTGWIRDVADFVFVSQCLADRFLKRYPQCANKTTVIHNSINTQTWHPRVQNTPQTRQIRKTYNLKANRTVLFVGRTLYEKGISYLIEAMARVRKQMPDAKLIIAGSPFFQTVQTNPFLEELKSRASQLGDGVIFTGYIDHDQTPHFYAAADITVMPTLFVEGFGKVIIESMATGTPVIASRRGAIPEIIQHNQDGILIDNPKDTHTLAKHIVRLLRHKTLRQRLGKRARKKAVAQFDTLVRLKRVQDFYNTLEDSPA